MVKKIFTCIILLLSTTMMRAQKVEMADQFRADGKIYVVVAVMLILLIGLFIYMFRIERKVKKLENK